MQQTPILNENSVVCLKQIVKHKLYDGQLQLLGIIHELLLHPMSGICKYIVFIPDPSLKSDGHVYLAAPWDKFTVNSEGQFILNISDAQFKGLIKISIENWHNGQFCDMVNNDAISKANDYPSLTLSPNINNNEQLVAIVKTQPKQTEKEILIDINSKGVNENPSEQNAYPGPQVYTPDSSK